MGPLFTLRLRDRVELHTRTHDWLPDLPPLVLQRSERVQVLDLPNATHFLCQTRHGIALLPHRTLKPERRP